MGMAASQARFLGLTARKTNVEYEGQQINQQRTTLANETANYYNDLLGMQVPVPPSVADYTKTVYTFQDGSLTNSITSMIAQPNGLYKISYVASWIDDFAAVSAPTSIVTRANGPSGINPVIGEPMYIATDYMVGAKTLRNLQDDITFRAINADGIVDPTKTGLYYNQADGKYYSDDTFTTEVTLGDGQHFVCEFADEYNDEYLNSLSADQLMRLHAEEQEYLAILMAQYGGTEADWAVRYVQNTSTGTWEPYFTKLTDLNSPDTVYQDNGPSLSYIPMYTIGSAQKNDEIKNIDARFEADATGRLISVTLHPDQPDQVTYAVATNSVTDQARYDDAMNQYEYDKYQYDQTIQEINAKIEIIQAEDKNLELRLKQLDTEQEAIQTEMDAVQKVIEKNTESTFKTFG